jgi:choline transport protein
MVQHPDRWWPISLDSSVCPQAVCGIHQLDPR